jgi:hypothetical protein
LNVFILEGSANKTTGVTSPDNNLTTPTNDSATTPVREPEKAPKDQSAPTDQSAKAPKDQPAKAREGRSAKVSTAQSETSQSVRRRLLSDIDESVIHFVAADPKLSQKLKVDLVRLNLPDLGTGNEF